MRKPNTKISVEALKSSGESAWVVDVAIIHSAGQPWHCALVQDLKTQRVLGWATARDADPTLVTRAVERACTRSVRTRPTSLYLDSGYANSAPKVISELACKEFQLRFMAGKERSLLQPLENVWRDLQARFTADGAAPTNDEWID
ncbi:hypothetical protein N1078_18780 [Pseudomonas sp. MIL19]|uniref:hypothetical protein n=1 Tax=Pseudomonas sp. MIL19 TaxID=2976979 RepID=UPI0023642EA1|nr:hypothetical protein [Pseudomonas sp. MIL19]MDD2162609.1 hypothetical protein [Pseudomonas sp. MIL19]